MARTDLATSPRLTDRERVRLLELLLEPEPLKQALLPPLLRAIAATQAGRGALVWDDPSETSLRPYLVVDHFAPRPRRNFRKDRLIGLPELSGHRIRSVSVFVGRCDSGEWFLVLDSLITPLRLDDQARAVVHSVANRTRKLLAVDHGGTPHLTLDPEPGRFPNWALLKDHGIDGDDLVRARFQLAHHLTDWGDRGLTGEHPGLRALGENLASSAEAELLRRAARLGEAGALHELPAALQSLGEYLEDRGRLEAAAEFYRLGYRAAGATRDVLRAIDLGHRIGRTHRKRGEWDEAMAWYELAVRIAEAAGDGGRAALVMDGIASVHRDRGNYPRARDTLREEIQLATAVDHRLAVARAEHNLLMVEARLGEHAEAIRAGWSAVQHYEEDADVLRALGDLAEVALMAGELKIAREAFSLVISGARDRELLANALGGYAEAWAQAGGLDQAMYLLDQLDAAGLPTVAQVQALRSRGRVLALAGDADRARELLSEALRQAEESGLGWFLFDLEKELAEMAATEALAAEPWAELDEVREGIARMAAESGG